MNSFQDLQKLAKLVRYYILYMTTKAGSGHATSSLSAADIMTYLFFEKLRFDVNDPGNLANDRVIFSKGHASPLLYALWIAAGVIKETDLDKYRQFRSELEGHPTPRFKFVDAATGSLGQGLSIGLGMAIALRAQSQKSLFARKLAQSKQVKSQNFPRVYVLLGDSEMAEGSVWEAIELASYYKVGNLVGIVDVNRLGQSTETMLAWNLDKYRCRIEAFGWDVFMCSGHDFREIGAAFDSLKFSNDKPKMIVAKTTKGKGVFFLENKEGWHGKVLSEEEFKKAIEELGDIDKSVRGRIEEPDTKFENQISKIKITNENSKLSYKVGEMVATRKAYGEALARFGEVDPRIVSLDAEVKNSTFAEIFKEKYPQRFYEMFIAEQNMVTVAVGLSKMGFVPFVSTFAAFFTRAFDQIRMSAYSRANIKFVGSHAGVSIGEDGPSQMGLEDFALFRSIFGSVVFCPADSVACQRLVEIAAENKGIFYLRTNRPATPVIYGNDESFKIGGSKVLKSSKSDKAVIISCGVTLFEAIKAADELKEEKINVRVVDAYSIKPIDEVTIRKSASEVDGNVIVVEDHYFDGGLGDAVLNVFAHKKDIKVFKLAVSKMPMSGKSDELFDFEGISAEKIVKTVLKILQ